MDWNDVVFRARTQCNKAWYGNTKLQCKFHVGRTCTSKVGQIVPHAPLCGVWWGWVWKLVIYKCRWLLMYLHVWGNKCEVFAQFWSQYSNIWQSWSKYMCRVLHPTMAKYDYENVTHTNADGKWDASMRIAMCTTCLHRFGNNIFIFDKVCLITCDVFCPHLGAPRGVYVSFDAIMCRICSFARTPYTSRGSLYSNFSLGDCVQQKLVQVYIVRVRHCSTSTHVIGT